MGKRKKTKRVSKKTGASGAVPLPAPPPGGSRQTWLMVGLSALSGVLWFLACADFDIWPLAWVAMVPSLWAIERAPTRRRALAYGWVTGLVANLGGFYWISGLLTRFAHLPLVLGLLGLFLLAAYQGLVFLLFAWAIRGLRRVSREQLGAPLPMALLAPVAMVAFELVVPFIFPWFLAITQAWVTPVIQIADITGPVGVTALLLAVNGAIYDAVTERIPRRRWLPAAGAAAVLAVALVYGFVRIHRVQAARAEAPGVMVGVVQGNIGFDEKGLKRRDLAQSQLRDQQERSAALEAGEVAAVDRFGRPIADPAGADLILWTESSYPYTLPRNLTEPNGGGTDLPVDRAARIRRGFDTPLIFGAVTRDFEDAEGYGWNTALMLDGDGRFVGRFDKIFLLMFGEYIPGLETFPFMKELLPKAAGHFNRGTEIVTFPFEHQGRDYRIGPMICYEDILPDFGRKLADRHPHLLVNLTNDAWFGDTAEPWEHLALSVFRAVEMRADLVRAVNPGVSAYIDATGKVYHESYAIDPGLEPRPADAFLAETVLMGGADGGGHTFYARFGDLFGWLCVLATLGLWVVWPRLRPKRSEAAPEETA